MERGTTGKIGCIALILCSLSLFIMLFIDMFEVHSSGNTHLVLTVSNFKSTAEFDRIHKMYVGIVEMKKNPNDADPAKLLFSESNYHKEAGKIAQRALKKQNFDTIYEIKCNYGAEERI